MTVKEVAIGCSKKGVQLYMASLKNESQEVVISAADS